MSESESPLEKRPPEETGAKKESSARKKMRALLEAEKIVRESQLSKAFEEIKKIVEEHMVKLHTEEQLRKLKKERSLSEARNVVAKRIEQDMDKMNLSEPKSEGLSGEEYEIDKNTFSKN